MPQPFRYRPEIDGLRCIAVLAVIAFHARESILPGGYLGVDVFFVISGYLITSIILQEAEEGTFSFAKFWERRIKRILPAACVTLLVASIFQNVWMFRPDLQHLATQKIACLISFSNFTFWMNAGDYWGNAAVESPFLHYWSLSVEEQYYLLYPLFLMLVFRSARKHLTPIICGLVVISFAAFAYGVSHYPSATFYLLPTRMWELGAGCLLASYSNRRVFATNSLGTITGISLIGFSFFFPFTPTGIGYDAVVAVVGTILVLCSGETSLSTILLQNRLAVFIGRISYSLYLWHWPILFSLRRIRDYGQVSSSILLGAIGFGSLVVLSLLSFYLVEEPFRKMKYGAPLAMVLAMTIGFGFIVIEPMVLDRPYVSQYDIPTWYGRYYDLNPTGDLGEAFETIAKSVNTPKSEASATAFKEGGIIRSRSTKDPRVVLIGDSHAVMWSKLVDEITEELDLTTSLWSINGELVFPYNDQVWQPGVCLTKGQRMEYDSARMRFIKKWNPDVVIIACGWEKVDKSVADELFDFLESNAKHVLLIESPPVLDRVGNRCLYQYLPFLGFSPSDSLTDNLVWKHVNFSNVLETRKKLVEFAFDRSNFSFVPTADLFTKEGGAIVASGKKVWYLDDDHLTNEGSEIARERIREAIQMSIQ